MMKRLQKFLLLHRNSLPAPLSFFKKQKKEERGSENVAFLLSIFQSRVSFDEGTTRVKKSKTQLFCIFLPKEPIMQTPYVFLSKRIFPPKKSMQFV